MASWNPSPTIGGANWQGNANLVTRQQLISSITPLYNISSFSTLNLLHLNVSSISAGYIYTSTIKADEIDISGLSYGSTIVVDNSVVLSSLLTISSMKGIEINVSSIKGFDINISSLSFNPSLSSFGFSPTITLGSNFGKGLGQGLATGLGGLLTGILGIGGIIGGTSVLNTGINAMTRARTGGFTEYNVYEEVAGVSQIQISTLGYDHPYYSSIYRFVSSTDGGQFAGLGVEYFASTIFPAGTKCIRTLGDPEYLATAPTSSIQAHSTWVPILNPDYQVKASNVQITYPDTRFSSPAISMSNFVKQNFIIPTPETLSTTTNSLSTLGQQTLINQNIFSTSFSYGSTNIIKSSFFFSTTWTSTFAFNTNWAIDDRTNLLLRPVGNSPLSIDVQSTTSLTNFYFLDTRSTTQTTTFLINPAKRLSVPPQSTLVINYTQAQQELVVLDGTMDNSGSAPPIPYYVFQGATLYGTSFQDLILNAGAAPEYYIDYQGYIYTYPDSNFVYQYNQLAANVAPYISPGTVPVYDKDGNPVNAAYGPLQLTIQAASNITGSRYYTQSNFYISSFIFPSTFLSTVAAPVNFCTINNYRQITSPTETILTSSNLNYSNYSSLQTVLTSTLGNMSLQFSTVTVGGQYSPQNDKPHTVKLNTRFVSSVYFSNSTYPYPYDTATSFKHVDLYGNPSYYDLSGFDYTLTSNADGDDWFVGKIPVINQFVTELGQFPPMKINVNGKILTGTNWNAPNSLMCRLSLYNYVFSYSTVVNTFTQAINPAFMSQGTRSPYPFVSFQGDVYASTISGYNPTIDQQMGLGVYFYAVQPGFTSNPSGVNFANYSNDGLSYIDFGVTSMAWDQFGATAQQAPAPPPPAPPPLPIDPNTIADLYVWFNPNSNTTVDANFDLLDWGNLGATSGTTTHTSNVYYANLNTHAFNSIKVPYYQPGSFDIFFQNWTPNNPGEITFFVVSRCLSDLTSNYPVISYLDTSPFNGIDTAVGFRAFYLEASNAFYFDYYNNSSGSVVSAEIPNPLSNLTVYTVRSQAGTGCNVVYYNSTRAHLVQDNPPTTTSGPNNYLLNNQYGTEQDLVEILYYNRALTDTEISQVQYYLNYKYKIY